MAFNAGLPQRKFSLLLNFQRQGKVNGPGNAGLDCLSFKSDSAATPNDPGGHTSGRRKHHPIVITREVDSSSPLLWQACVAGDVLTSAVLNFQKPGIGGSQSSLQSIELINGTIIHIKNAPPVGGKACHNISLSFQDIKVNGAPCADSTGLEAKWRGPWG
jgi:type VI secretion system secreted protein Hcp